jgi:hypothetical protein
MTRVVRFFEHRPDQWQGRDEMSRERARLRKVRAADAVGQAAADRYTHVAPRLVSDVPESQQPRRQQKRVGLRRANQPVHDPDEDRDLEDLLDLHESAVGDFNAPQQAAARVQHEADEEDQAQRRPVARLVGAHAAKHHSEDRRRRRHQRRADVDASGARVPPLVVRIHVIDDDVQQHAVDRTGEGRARSHGIQHPEGDRRQ